MLQKLLTWIKGWFAKDEPPVKKKKPTIESQIEDEALQMVQRGEDDKMAYHIALCAARLKKNNTPPEKALDEAGRMEHPEYNVWHKQAARYNEMSIADYIYERYIRELSREKSSS